MQKIIGYSKAEQLKSNKVKKEPSFGKKNYKWNNKGIQRITNDSELSYIQWLRNQQLQCLICGSNEVELHHIKRSSTDKKNHKQLLPLCREHHTGSSISPHGAKKQFFEIYPFESQVIIADKLYENYEIL
jgi:hypothetical protein